MNIMGGISSHHQLIDALEKHAQPLGRTGIDYDTLIQAIRRHSEGKNLILIGEATHGTAPKYADQDKVNPSSVILSAEMMFRYMGWPDAADLIVKGVEGAITAKTVTYDFARAMDGAQLVSCSGFGDAVISHM